MDIGDCSLWHHLIFCEELQNDEENEEMGSEEESEETKSEEENEETGSEEESEETKSEEENEETGSEEESEETKSEEDNEETGSEEENEETESDDGNNQVVCWVCKESVLGHPAYKCLECNFLQHKSCINPTPAIKMLVKHHLRRRHHLMFTEELGNTGNEEQVCPGCEEPVFGPAYKCSIPGCNFLMHKQCTDLSHVIQHPVHSKHTLILQVPSKRNYCDACRNCCSRCFLYRCSHCDYDLDVKCRSRWRINADNCHQHAFVRTLTQIQFICQVCGEESKDTAYLCSICQLLIHHKCAQFHRTVKILAHNHSLTLTYSLPQFKGHNDIFCKLCYKKVNTEYATYSCLACIYIAHLNCTTEFSKLSKDLGMRPCFFDDDTKLVHLVEGIKLAKDERANPREIKHFSHPQHYLILIDEELMENKHCEACMQFIISIPFYGCVTCNFFLHYRCAKLVPLTIKRLRLDDHPLTLLSEAQSRDGLFWCNICKRHRHGFTYKCDKCEGDYFDVQCCLIPKTLEHEGHQHSLFLPEMFSGACNACGVERQYQFTCTNCKFYLCFICATFPLVARHEYDTHLLKLSYAREDDSGEYYCLICEEKRDHPDYWFYYCEKCNFPAHSQCVLGTNPYINYGRTYIDEDHQHPLTIVQKTKHSPPCDVCGNYFKDMAIECTQCKFNVHRKCLRDLNKERVK